MTGLSPHEELMGRPMFTGTSPPLTPHKVTLMWTDDYMIVLHLQVSDRLPKPLEGPIHSFQCGDYVLFTSKLPVAFS